MDTARSRRSQGGRGQKTLVHLSRSSLGNGFFAAFSGTVLSEILWVLAVVHSLGNLQTGDVLAARWDKRTTQTCLMAFRRCKKKMRETCGNERTPFPRELVEKLPERFLAPPSVGGQGRGNHVGRNHVGRFMRTGCTGMSAQVHGLHH